jgi:hypothetical protein
LTALLAAHEAKDMYPDFEITWCKEKGLYLCTGESSTPDDLSEEFLKALGKLIGAAGLPYLEVGCAFTCDKYRAGSHGGNDFRIYPDGRLISALKVWPVVGDNPLCKCANCGFKANYADLPDAKDLDKRHGIGDVFSDAECPKCGALCFPV